jgi:N-acetylglucosaminyldiphosphoundecaprenol N-acetyl-beta-D-mannosaminyltransferase
MSQDILGYAVDGDTQEEIVESVSRTLAEGARECRWLACLNPHSYAVARSDAAFASALHAAHWLIPDGIGIVLAGRVLRTPVAGRITGADIFHGVMARLNEMGGSVFFLGGSEQTLHLIREKVAEDYPRVRLVGTLSPPFKAKYTGAGLDEMIDRVNRSGAEVLWVGMTAPKQEKWIHSSRKRLEVTFAGAIGAVFDFYTGQVKRSSPSFRRLGLEWVPRLVQQPRRLWRRTFVSAPIFLFDLIRVRLVGPPSTRGKGQ